MQKNTREIIIADLQKKEQAEQYLSNLEGLKKAGSVEENLYTILKKEYLTMREQAIRSIVELKGTVQQEIVEIKSDLSIFKEELYNLETRFKVGQITAETFQKRSKTPLQKAKKLEQQITDMQLIIDATTSRALQSEPSPKKGKWTLFFNKGKTEPSIASEAGIQENIPTSPEPQPTQPEIIQEVFMSPEPAAVQNDQIQQQPEPSLSAILITDLTIMPDRVELEGTLGIMANAHNRTAEELTDIIELNIDGNLEQAMTITLKPWETREITFIISAGTAGNHTATIGTITGTFVVYQQG